MIPMKHKRLEWIHLILLGVLLLPAAVSGEERVIPLPIRELEEVLSKWWQQAGFEIQRSSGKEVLCIRVSAGEASGRFDLSPRSAIAARITATVENDAGGLSTTMERWWRYLSLYIHGPTSRTATVEPTFPVPVLSKIESVVCIRIATGEDKDRLSGVVVDGSGLVISTAHGIPEGQEIILTLYDGTECPGVLLHRDTAQDLALIQFKGPVLEAVSLINGRNLLGMGEQVFSIGCVGELQGTVTSGVINGPPRRVDDQPLWQVHMEILPGKSGSPVFDNQGNLVALVKGRYRGTSSVGFLIPLETIIHFLKEGSPL
jgi:serine protease Do